MSGLLIDNFAGGGGASTGIEAAMGRAVDVAINHDPEALAMHATNHPATVHLCQSIMAVDPLEATGGQPVALAWFSPDCKHHSKAKGGQPREKGIRDLAWVVVHWAERLRKATPHGRGMPAVICLENVEEFRQWGPLDSEGKPIPERRGEEFDLWVRRLRAQGYRVEWRELRACDYGAPTSRKRLYLVAQRSGAFGGMPIVWPQPTHGKPGSPEVLSGQRLPWRTAATCIDWSIPCPSIFDRPRPLKDTTHRRIAHGVMRYVVDVAKPFIVPLTHHGGAGRVYDADTPFPTVTGANRGEMAAVDAQVAPFVVGTSFTNTRAARVFDPMDPLRTATAQPEFAAVGATMIMMGYGERAGQTPRVPGLDVPARTVVSGGGKHGLVTANMLKLRNNCVGSAVDEPVHVISTGGHHGVVTAHLEKYNADTRPRPCDAPLDTVMASSAQYGVISSFLHKYRPNSVGASMDEPAPTVTANSFIKRPGGAPPISVVCAHMEQANGGPRNERLCGRPVTMPMSTLTASGSQQRVVATTMIEAGALPPDMMDRAVQVAAFLIKYYGAAAHGQQVDEPLHVVTSKARFAVVTVTIDAATYILVDIGMRMLTPRELARAQGFPDRYVLDPIGPNGKPLTKTAQIRMIGNSVCPDVAAALVRANVAGAAQIDRAAA